MGRLVTVSRWGAKCPREVFKVLAPYVLASNCLLSMDPALIFSPLAKNTPKWGAKCLDKVQKAWTNPFFSMVGA